MRLRIKHIAIAAILAAAGLASFAAIGLGDQDGAAGQKLAIVDRVEMETVRSERLSGAEAAARGFAIASKKKKIKVALHADYLLGATPVPVGPASGVLVPLQCPGKSIPVSGGLRNNNVALVENSSSRTTTAAGAPPADWYEGVSNTNQAGGALSFQPTLVCLKLQ